MEKTSNIYNNTTNNEFGVLNPWFLTGFTDAEGCFILAIFKDDTKTMG